MKVSEFSTSSLTLKNLRRLNLRIPRNTKHFVQCPNLRQSVECRDNDLRFVAFVGILRHSPQTLPLERHLLLSSHLHPLLCGLHLLRRHWSEEVECLDVVNIEIELGELLDIQRLLLLLTHRRDDIWIQDILGQGLESTTLHRCPHLHIVRRLEFELRIGVQNVYRINLEALPVWTENRHNLLWVEEHANQLPQLCEHRV